MLLPHTRGNAVSELGRDFCSAKPTAPQATILIQAWQEQTQMSPDYPTNGIMSDKRLIGQHTMSFPLIKELLRKTKIATKHCQQSNQQQQLAVNWVPSWALCSERGRRGGGRLLWVSNRRDRRSQGWPGEKRGCSLLHTQEVCSKTLGLGGRRGGGAEAAACWLVSVQQWSGGDVIKNPAASFQSSWKSTGCSPCYLFALNHSSSQPETILRIFKICKQFISISFMRVSQLQHMWILPLLNSHKRLPSILQGR